MAVLSKYPCTDDKASQSSMQLIQNTWMSKGIPLSHTHNPLFIISLWSVNRLQLRRLRQLPLLHHMWMLLFIPLSEVNVNMIPQKITCRQFFYFAKFQSSSCFCSKILLNDSCTLPLCVPQVQRHGTSLYCSDLLDDGGCVALLVVGFLLLAPLLVLALAAYCRMARHLQLGLCFIPYSRAVYKNLPASRHRGLGGCCGQQGAGESEGKGSVWVWADWKT